MPTGRPFISKWEQISTVIKEIKQLAGKLNRPIVLTVQLNRNVRSDSKKEIDASDVAGSDSIPQDASILVGVRKGISPYQHVRRLCDVVKNREGETGTYQINFRFTPMNFDEVPYEPPAPDGEGEQRRAPNAENQSWML